MDEVESLLEHVADMRIENILAELKQEDSEYQSYIECINKTSAKHDEIMNGLSEEDKLFIEEYWMNFLIRYQSRTNIYITADTKTALSFSSGSA